MMLLPGVTGVRCVQPAEPSELRPTWQRQREYRRELSLAFRDAVQSHQHHRLTHFQVSGKYVFQPTPLQQYC